MIMTTLKETKPNYIGHRQRIKTKYEQQGLKGWLDYEVLELLLAYAAPRKDSKPIAKALLSKYKTLVNVLNAGIEDLQTVKGVAHHSALFLKLLKDVAVAYAQHDLQARNLLSSPQLVYAYLKARLKGQSKEEVVLLFVDNRNCLIAVESITSGTVGQASVHPRNVVERALYHHAAGLIIAHNHPGRSLEPSLQDRQLTKTLKAALATVDVGLLDHIIIAGNDYFSFKAHGLSCLA